MADFAGAFVPNTTPFDAGGELDLGALASNIRAFADAGVAGFVVGGSTGEAVLLDADERAACVRTVRDAAPGLRVIAGTGAESLRTTLAYTRAAVEAGADALLVQPPAFYTGAMTPEVLVEHFTAVADASAVPVLVYQVPPKFATLVFPDEVIAELARHPNIAGLKDSRGDLEGLRRWVEITPEDFEVLVGNGALLLEALRAGAVGGILGVANVVPAECAALVRAFSEGRMEDAEALGRVVAPLHNGIVGGMGVPGVKAALDRLGRAGGAPRPPLRPLPEARSAELSTLLEGVPAPA
jgi:4-hydroxy-2-oxoglutarate aldolase